MKYFISIILIVLLVSCEARIDNNKRAAFKTKVVDINDNPIENVEVILYSGFYFNSLQSSDLAKFSDVEEDFILGSGFTDANGEVSFLALVNTDEQTSFSLTATGYPQRNITISDSNYADDLEYNIPTQMLKPLSMVIVEFSNTSGTTDVLDAFLRFESLNCSQFTETGISEDVVCDGREFYAINNPNGIPAIEIETVFPSLLIVEYEDTVGATITEQFMITNATENYVIQY